MNISKYNSDKIKILSFISILFVIYIHSPYVEASKYQIASKVQGFMADFGLAIFAVPMFFFISGLLFFKGIKSVKDCFTKIKQRVSSLLVPYIIWNLVFVGWYVAMAFTPGVSQFVNSDMIGHLSWHDPEGTLSFLFLEPAGFHLWFLRDLFLYMLLSPILYMAIKRTPWISLLITFLAVNWIPRMGITFFMLGGIVALHYGLETIERWLSKPVVMGCLMFYILNALVTITIGVRPGNILWQYYVQIAELFSVAAIWGLYNHFVKGDYKLSVSLNRMMSYTFFIYLFHEPIFNIVKKLGLKILGENEVSLTILFMLNPFIIVALSTVVGMVFQKLFPRLYNVCVGGR